MRCGQTSLTTLQTDKPTSRPPVQKYGDKQVRNRLSILYGNASMFRETVVFFFYSRSSDGKVDAVTFGTGTGGTLSGGR